MNISSTNIETRTKIDPSSSNDCDIELITIRGVAIVEMILRFHERGKSSASNA